MQLPPSRPSWALHRVFWTLLIGVFLTVAYRRFLLDAPDPYRCHALLNEGGWLDPPNQHFLDRPFQRWQPPRCMLHEYHASGLAGCFRSRRVVIAGDSTTRQIYWAIAKKLDHDRANRELSEAPKQEDLMFKHNEVELNFVWDPYLNSSRLHNELLQYQNAKASLREPGKAKKNPALIIIGGGLWYARFIQHNPVAEFQTAMETIVPMLALPPQQSSQFPLLPGEHGSDDLVFIMPVETPVYEQLSPSRMIRVTPEKIDAMNQYLYQLSKRPGLDVLWSYRLMTHDEPETLGESGFHVVETVANRRADVVLNLRCNAGATARGRYPVDRTCCSGYRRPNWMQSIALLGFLGSLGLVSLLHVISNTGSKGNKTAASSPMLRSTLVILFTVLYCFFADRSPLFTKLQKFYAPSAALVLGGLMVCFGLFSIRRVPADGITSAMQKRTLQRTFLPRAVADEWKGWVVAIVLVYRLTEAWKVIWVYEAVRLIMGSYLFLLSFEHSVYFLSTRDYSLRRVGSVLFRLNFFNVVLPFIMRTDYLYYPFAPLLSFWFVAIFIILRSGSSFNEHVPILLAKILFFGTLFTISITFAGPLNVVSTVLKYTCRISWKTERFRLRLGLDLFVAYAGMITAIIYVRLTRTPKHLIQGRERRLHNIIRHHFEQIRAFFILLAVNLLIICGIVIYVGPNTEDYNTWMRWFSFIPAICFAILRNADRRLRNMHSTVFAWLGRCSVEIFTLHYHIWMAGDGKGVLGIGLFGPNYGWSNNGRWEEFAVVTVLFLCLCGSVSHAISAVTSSFIGLCGKDERDVSIDPTGVSEVRTGLYGYEADLNGKQPKDLPLTQNFEVNGSFSAILANGNGHGNGLLSPPLPPSRRKGILRKFLPSKLKTRLITCLVVMWICNLFYN
ncbi:Cas1p-domain-containing protein [Xylona heveae TC161]|uniref:Cas1p-domain-containing protein n=1 Tax=Xylona heveae (strain CBS 132557 / TC161) TaxID=1328760 RepID=A0A161TE10_XYLHT|nr:Cas1p-domain-containing protein [Xylona heveae TC161]KZF24137.1 Cas1p-domain-containing protein [Xylona heveae TC161]